MNAKDRNSPGSLGSPWHCFVCPLRSMADPDDPVFSGDLYTAIVVEHAGYSQNAGRNELVIRARWVWKLRDDQPNRMHCIHSRRTCCICTVHPDIPTFLPTFRVFQRSRTSSLVAW